MTTNADRARWQAQTVKYLAELVALGGKHDLPPLYWSTGSANLTVLKGEPLFPWGAERQRIFNQWCNLLNAVPDEPRITEGGARTQLRAYARNVGFEGTVTVLIEADVWKED